jgi:plasmid stabilization system protein ParE
MFYSFTGAIASQSKFNPSTFTRYVIFYRSATDAIEVVRVLHGARDIENIFEG